MRTEQKSVYLQEFKHFSKKILMFSLIAWLSACAVARTGQPRSDSDLAAAGGDSDSYYSKLMADLQKLMQKIASVTADEKESGLNLQANDPAARRAQLNTALLDSVNTYYNLSRDVLLILRDMRDRVSPRDVDILRQMIQTAMPLLQNMAMLGSQILMEARVIAPGLESAITTAYINNLPGIVDSNFNLTVALLNNLGPREIDSIIKLLDAMIGMVNSHSDLLNIGLIPVDMAINRIQGANGGNQPNNNRSQTGNTSAAPKPEINCKNYNQNGVTCEQLGIRPGGFTCKWGANWRCDNGCGRWLGLGWCP